MDGDGETKGERTRRRLLEIAVRRFADDGYRATSVSAVARDAGLSQAAVYAYFANKEALFDAAVDLDAAELIAGARAELDEELPLVDLIPGLLLHLRLGVEHHRLARRVLAGQEPEVIHRLADLPALQDITAELAGLLQAGRAGARSTPTSTPPPWPSASRPSCSACSCPRSRSPARPTAASPPSSPSSRPSSAPRPDRSGGSGARWSPPLEPPERARAGRG